MRRTGRTTLLGTTSKFCSMGMFDNWMGSGTPKKETVEVKTPVPGEKTPADGTAPKKQNDGGNDGGTDNDLVEQLWKDEQRQAADTQSSNKDEPDSDKQMANYLKQQGLEPLVLTEVELEAFKSGEGVQATIDTINKRIVNSHLGMLRATDVLVKSKVDAAVKAAVGQSSTLIRDDKARDALRTALPWTSMPDFAPVAETVLKRFMDKPGVTTEQAVKLTKIYFEKQQAAMDPDVNINTNNGGNNRQARRTPSNPGSIDFTALLTGEE